MNRMQKKHKRLQVSDTQLPLWLGIPVLLFVTLLLMVVLLRADNTPPQTVPGLVTARQAAVYSEANETAATQYAVPHNVLLTVLEEKDGWYYTCIKREEGLYGWLKASDMTLPSKMACDGISGPSGTVGTLVGSAGNMASEAALPTGTMRLHAGPGNVYGKTEKIALPAPAQILSYEDGWFHITTAAGSMEGYVPADSLLLDANPLMVFEDTDPADDGKQDDTSSTDDGKKDESTSTDDGKKDESTSTDDGKKDEQSSTDDGKKDEQSSTDDGKKDETSSTDDGKKDETPQTEEKKPPVALPSSDTSVLAAGVISDSAVRLRKGAGTSTDIITEMSKGVPVKVLGWKDGWYKVEYNGKKGYVSDELIKVYPTADSLKGYAVVDTDALNMRSKASTDGKIVKVLDEGDVLTLQGFQNGWFKVKYDGKTGYVSGDYVKLRLTKPAEPTTGSTGSSAPSGGNAGNGSGTGAEIAAYAQTFIGVPYVYGGASPKGFDCSGFIKYVYAHFGYSLPHGTNAQYGYGKKVSKADLQPGDLVFFNNGGNPTTHAGIYIGNGKFVHSTEYDYGDRVVDGVQIHPLSNSYYKGIYVGARRIVK